MMVNRSPTFIIPNKNYLTERKKKLYRKFLILIIKKPASLIFYNNLLRALKKEIDDESFDKVIEEQIYSINSYNETYVSEEGLDVYYLIRNELIYLFSYGEYQSGRYMLFLEGLWYYEPWDEEE
jgi:hypothetical protein